MDRPTEQVYRGFLSLTDAQRNELVKAINDYYAANAVTQKALRDNAIKRVDLGPIASASCPCCGR